MSQMLPARNRDLIQKWFIQHRDLERTIKDEEAWRHYAGWGLYLFGAPLLLSLFRDASEATSILGTIVLVCFIASALTFYDQRRSIRKKEDRIQELEQRFRELGFYVTDDGLSTPAGERCDPLSTEAYDPNRPSIL